jgi:hypothetical protein
MQQFRVVFQYSKGFTRGAGAAFVIALNEENARAQFALDMPGADLVHMRLEQEDPLAQYERPLLTVLKGGAR